MLCSMYSHMYYGFRLIQLQHEQQTIIMNKKYNNNHFIIASRAYFQQSPTCTRVNNLVHITMNPTPMGFVHILLVREVYQSMSLNLSDPCVLYKSLCHLVDAATTRYLELFQITALLYESGSLLRVIRISVKVCIDVTLYDELFYHLHNRENSLVHQLLRISSIAVV